MGHSNPRSSRLQMDSMSDEKKALFRVQVAQLVLRAKAYDQEAWKTLYHLHRNLVFSIVRRLVSNPNDIEELVQESFVRAAKHLPQLEQPEQFKNWLGTIARRIALTFLRNETKRRAREFCEETEIVLNAAKSREPDPSEELSSREHTLCLQVQMAQLRREDREILYAFYFDELSINQIAEQFSLKVGTVKRRLHTARHRSQAILESCNGMYCSRGSH